jgi:hypothetical protein
MRPLLACLAWPLLLFSCAEHHQVQLILGGASESRLPQSFRCGSEDRTRALITRTFTAPNTVSFNLVVDFIRLGGLPYASPVSVITWCEDHDCQVMAPGGQRYCLPLSTTVPGGGLLQIRQGVIDILQRLPGQNVVEDAPDEPVVVRMVATMEPCSAITADHRFVEAELVACAVSVPIDGFDSLEGDVVLELPTVDDRCEQQVFSCATTAFE